MSGLKFTLCDLTSFLPDKLSGLKRNIFRPADCLKIFSLPLTSFIMNQIFEYNPNLTQVKKPPSIKAEH